MNRSVEITSSELEECFYCWTRKGDKEPYSDKLTTSLNGYQYTIPSQKEQRNICDSCMKKALEHFDEDIYQKFWTNCKICRQSYPEDRKIFNRSFSFGFCGGPSFVCKTCIKDGFEVVSGTGGPMQIFHEGLLVPTQEPSDDSSKPYYFSDKTWEFVKEHSTVWKQLNDD